MLLRVLVPVRASPSARRRGRSFLRWFVSDDLDAAVGDAARRQEAVGDALEFVAAAVQHDHFEAAILIEVNVKRRADAVAQPMLELRELLGQLADVVIVDEGERRDGGCALAHARAYDFRPDEIAEDFRARHAAVLHDAVQSGEQVLFHRHAEPHQLRLHRPHRNAERRKKSVRHRLGMRRERLARLLTVW